MPRLGLKFMLSNFLLVNLVFGQTWPITPCYSKSLKERFHTITKELRISKTFISSTPTPISVVPISTRCPVPSSSPSKSPHHARRSAAVSLQSSSPPTQTGIIKGTSSHTWPALDPSKQSGDNDDVMSLSSSEEIRVPSLLRKLLFHSFLQALLHLYHPMRKFCLKKSSKAKNLQSPNQLESFHLSRALILHVWNQKDANAILHSIQDLFTSWEQVKACHASRSSLANRPSAASAAFSIETMNILNHAVLEYTSFMDMDIVNASATSQ
ncbi:hypothetical protein Adt_07036 [Abeliophyllum distichum]|uniref:Uncharacterized protein n=1 Tax=Abeliophyllum distichum TaxID=126358 RepID=A0ABD1V8L1_9LAMI